MYPPVAHARMSRMLSVYSLSPALLSCDCLRPSATMVAGPAGRGKGECSLFECGHPQDSAGLRVEAATGHWSLKSQAGRMG